MKCGYLIQESALNTDQQVVGQHTQKDMSFDPAFQPVEDGSLAQGAFHRTEGSFNPAQQHISAPDVFGTQVAAAAL